MKSASYEYRKMSARRGAQFVPIGMPTVCWKTFPAKTTKILSTRNSSILMMSSSEYLLLESECSFTKYVSPCPNTKYFASGTYENYTRQDKASAIEQQPPFGDHKCSNTLPQNRVYIIHVHCIHCSPGIVSGRDFARFSHLFL